jgi:hypothetical protein
MTENSSLKTALEPVLPGVAAFFFESSV